LVRKGAKIYASTTGEQGSGILSSMVKAQGLIVLPAEGTLARAGQKVDVILLDPTFSHTPLPTYFTPSHNLPRHKKKI